MDDPRHDAPLLVHPGRHPTDVQRGRRGLRRAAGPPCGFYDTADVTYTDTSGLDTTSRCRPFPCCRTPGSTASPSSTLGRATRQTGRRTVTSRSPSQTSRRGASSATLTSPVTLPGGGQKSAALLEAGCDRVQHRLTPRPGKFRLPAPGRVTPPVHPPTRDRPADDEERSRSASA